MQTFKRTLTAFHFFATLHEGNRTDRGDGWISSLLLHTSVKVDLKPQMAHMNRSEDNLSDKQQCTVLEERLWVYFLHCHFAEITSLVES